MVSLEKLICVKSGDIYFEARRKGLTSQLICYFIENTRNLDFVVFLVTPGGSWWPRLMSRYDVL